MRFFYIFIFTHLCSSVFGQQLYFEDVARDSVDRIQKRAQENFSQTNLNPAQLGFDSLLQFWSNEKIDSPADSVLHNYYYATIKSYEVKNKFKLLDTIDREFIMSLEMPINQHLVMNNNLLGMYYSFIGDIQGKSEIGIQKSIQYTNKSIDIFKNNTADNDKLISRAYIQLGNLYKNLGDYSKAENLFLLSLEHAKKLQPRNESSILFKRYSLANVYNLQHRHQDALRELNQIIAASTTVLNPGHDLVINSYDLLSIVYDNMGEIETALDYSFKALKTIRQKKEGTQAQIEKSYSLISGRYRKLGNNRLAKIYLDSSLFLMKDSKNYRRLSYVYNSKALLSRDLNDEIQSLQLAISYCKKDNWCAKVNMPIFLQNLGIAFAQSGDFQTGLNYTLEAKKFKENNKEKSGVSLASTYMVIAILYNELDSLDNAILYQDKAVEVAAHFKGNESHFTAQHKSSLGNYLIKKKDFKLAKKYLFDAKPILDAKLGSTSGVTLLNLRHISALYEEQGQYDLSIKYMMEAYKAFEIKEQASQGATNPYIINLIKLYQKLGKPDSCKHYLKKALDQTGYEEFNQKDFKLDSMPDYNYWVIHDRLSSYLKLEGEIYGEDQQFIKTKIQALIDVSDKLRTQFFYETSEKDIQDGIRSFFNWAIHKLSIQYQRTHNKEYLELMFECIEKSKSLLIDRQYARKDAINSKNVPEKIVLREKNLLFQYENAYNNYLKATGESPDSLMDSLSNLMFAIQKEKEQFIDSLKNFYPNYYFNRYERKIVDITQSQALAFDQNRTFAIFHWADSILHKLIIQPDTILYSNINTKLVTKEIEPLIDILASQNGSETETNYTREKSDFITHSSNLYTLLFDYENFKFNFDLTIIPDGKLIHLPFDILLKTNIDSTSTYQHLPYLVNEHVINYVESMSNYTYILNHRTDKKDVDYVGFAPSYGDTLFYSNSLTRGDYKLNPLLYNTKEIESASKLLNGKQFVLNDATEKAFKSYGSNNNILHLAMHTRINDRFPLESHLIFGSDSCSTEDGNLYVDEISKLNLNNNLVVLSACETNVGEAVSGEGILGIARAFQIALCPNIILTNWLVDDKSSAVIMNEFFIGLKKKHSPAVALRDSKITFLKNASTIHAHPKYWAAFSFYGDPKPTITQASIFTNRHTLFFLGGLASILLFFSRKAFRKPS